MQIGHAKAAFLFLDDTRVAIRFVKNTVAATGLGTERKARFYRGIEYIQRSFKQETSIGTGTTSDADWACQGNDFFYNIQE